MFILFQIELKRQAEIPENAAKEHHQKLWEGWFIELMKCFQIIFL